MHWAIWDAMFKAQNGVRRRDLELPEPLRRRRHAPDRVPARPPVRRAVGQPRARGRELLIEPSATRDRLTAGMYIAKAGDDPVGADRARARGDARGRAGRAKLRAAAKERAPRREARAGRGHRRAGRARARPRASSPPAEGAAVIARARAHGEGDPRRRLRAGPRRIRRRPSTAAIGAQPTPSPSVVRQALAGVADAANRAVVSSDQPNERTDLHHRRRAHAVPQVAQPARARSPPPTSRPPPAARCSSASPSRRPSSTK